MSEPTNTFQSDPPSDPGATRLSTGSGSSSSGGEVPPAPPGFELRDEIGRGGMGIVVRAFDTALGRDVAVKLLQPGYRVGSATARRFAEEARITSRLPHPGIPPVHQVGTFEDGRPYLVMKLIEGQTLDTISAGAGTDPRAELAHFTTVFEQVCQAVAFAHSKGVIHRDLKPANIMVGAFGEVQVMDWGLAKELRSTEPRERSEAPKAVPLPTDPGFEFRTTCHEPDERPSAISPDMTVAGSVLGTPAYMAPEQARGEVDRVDRRSDVFGLGAVLCVILAGEPPFGVSSSDAARALGMRGDLEPAFAKLDQVGGEPELVALCKRCLSPDPADRPADAGAVALAVQRILEGAEERAVRAELDRARVETRAAELRKRRRVWAGLAGAVFLLALALWWADHQQAERRREREVNAARDREGITASLDAAEVALRAGHLSDAEAALALAEKRLAEHPDADPDGRFASLDRDRDMVRELERALDRAWTDSQKGVASFAPETVALYPAAFDRYGLRVGTDETEKIVAAVRASRIDDELTTGLREWFIIDHTRPGLREVLNRLDPDPERVAIRAAVAEDNADRIRALAARADPHRLAPGIAVLLGMNPAVPAERAIALLAGAWQANPDNFPLALRIGFRLETLRPTRDPKLLAEAVGWCRAAVALRPRSAAAHKLLANALFDSTDYDGALAEYRTAIGFNPNLARAHSNVGHILNARGDYRGAAESCRAALRIDAGAWEAHEVLGAALTALSDHAGAVEAYRGLVKLRPKAASARLALARALFRIDRSRECAEQVVEIQVADPAFLDDRRTEARFLGARAGALSGTGGGADAPPPAERASYRRRAYFWARAELGSLTAEKALSLPQSERVRQWLTDPSFSGVRDPARLAELPPTECAEWEKLWTEARSLLHKLDDPPKPEEKGK